MTYEQYRRKVSAEIIRLIGGKPSFKMDRQILEYSHWQNFPPSVPAEVMIEKAILAAKRKK